MRRPVRRLAVAFLLLSLCPTAPFALEGALLLEEARALSDRGEAAAAREQLVRARWSAGDPALRRLAETLLRRSEASLPETLRWDWAVLPSDNLGSPAGVEDLPFAMAWLMSEEVLSRGYSRTAPLHRVVAALDRLPEGAAAATPALASTLPIQTIEGLKVRLAMLPGPTGKPLYSGAIDPEAGPGLRDALRAFQSLKGLEPTGEADGRTMGAIQEAYEQALLRPTRPIEAAGIVDLSAAIPARHLIRSSLRVREGRLVFEVAILDAQGRRLWGPVVDEGPLENGAIIARSTLLRLLDLIPAEWRPERFSGIEEPLPSLADLREAGRWALVRARGDLTLARLRGSALRERNPGWERVLVAVDADQAGPSEIASWEDALRRRVLLLGSVGEEDIPLTLEETVSEMPGVFGSPGDARRGPVKALGGEGRLRLEGRFP